MKVIKQLFCKHDFTWHGWYYVICKKCDIKKYDPAKNEKLQGEFLKRHIIEGDPVFSRESLNKQLSKYGRSI